MAGSYHRAQPFPGDAAGPRLAASPLTGPHTLRGRFLPSLAATNHTSLGVGAAECGGRGRASATFPGLTPPRGVLCLSQNC